MFGKNSSTLKKILIIPSAMLCIFLMFTLGGSLNVQASVWDDIPDNAASYTLVWPDESKKTFTDRQEAEEAWEKEKLLGTYTTGENGQISLEGYAAKGNIRLFESVVPEGYTADKLSTPAELSDGSIILVNHKEHKDTPSKKNDSNNSKHSSSPKTGDPDAASIWKIIAASSAVAAVSALSVILIRRKKGKMLIVFLTAGAIGAGTLAASVKATAEDRSSAFTVNKTDDEGNPVKGAVFEVYGKPYDVTWEPAPDVQTSDIVILYTNDVHCGVDNNVGYAGVAAYKKDMEDAGNAVILVDDGDHVQGASLGTLTKGEALIDIMNAMGYDAVTPGNHEFDYGADQFLTLAEKADFPYVSCNFTDLRTGELVFEPYKIMETAGRKIAFVGVTTANTILESTPGRFSDKDGNIIYGFCEGADGRNLYNAVQKAVDSARAEGADYCILLGHLGSNASYSPYTSSEVINNTTGIDAVIDGHSHTIMEMEKVKNAEGHDVVLTQDGYQLPYIAKVTIDRAGNIRSELIDNYTKKDEYITGIVNREKYKFNQILSEEVGTTDHDLLAKDENGNWLVRNGETNLGDFVADAYKYIADADVGFINGGGLRENISSGTITYGNLLDVAPYSDYIYLKNVTGRDLADALEFSVHSFPDLNGGFLQVSGVTFDVDASVASPVVTNEDGSFAYVGEGTRRVSNIKVNGEDIDYNRTYKCASIDFILSDEGNGYTMFKGDLINFGKNITDVDSLKEYIKSLGGVVPDSYSDPEGQGRINFIQNAEE